MNTHQQLYLKATTLAIVLTIASLIGCANDVSVVTPKSFPIIADSLDISTESSNGGVIALSPDGTRLALWYESNLTIYETNTGKIVSECNNIPQKYQGYCEFTVDNKRILLATDIFSSYIYDISQPTAKILLTLPNVTNAHISDDGLRVIVGGGLSEPPSLKVLSVFDGSIEKELHPKEFYDSQQMQCFKRSENEIVYLFQDTGLKCIVWSLDSDQEVSRFDVINYSGLVFCSNDGYMIAIYEENFVLRTYNTQNGNALPYLYLKNFGKRVYNPIAITKEFMCLNSLIDTINTMNVINMSDGSLLIKKDLPSSATPLSIAASRWENCVAVQMSGGLIRLWKI